MSSSRCMLTGRKGGQAARVQAAIELAASQGAMHEVNQHSAAWALKEVTSR